MARPLRVSVIGKRFPDSFAACAVRAFEELGHSVQTFDDGFFPVGLPFARLRMVWALAAERLAGLRRLTARSVARRVVAYRPDLVVSVSKTLPASVIASIKADTDATAVFWFPDAVSNLGRQYFLTSPFDLYCFKDPFLVELMQKKLGLPAVLLPDAAPLVAPWGPLPAPSCDLLIACNLYPFRLRLIETLPDFRWQIYGNIPLWLDSPMLRYHTRQYLSGERKADAYRRAAIVFNNHHFAEIGGINARTFEVCGTGAFLLTDGCPALGEYYEPNVEVGVYSGIDDLRDQVQFYLDRPRLRERMAARAQQRTQREHTYIHRVQRLLELAKNQGGLEC